MRLPGVARGLLAEPTEVSPFGLPHPVPRWGAALHVRTSGGTGTRFDGDGSGTEVNAKGRFEHAAGTGRVLGLGREQRRRVQSCLKGLGFDPGGMDGVFGPRTRAAIRAWQASRGDEESGYLDEESSNRLGAGDGGCPGEPQARNAARIEPEAAPAPAPARSKGDVFRDCDACPEMVVVPAGQFQMGSPDSERGRFSGEGPVHRVTIGEPFAAGVYEVTFEEWDACVLDGGCGGYRPHDEGWGRGRRPVINVSWNDARSYVGWLSQRTGEEYRLLSESEWEYRGGRGR